MSDNGNQLDAWRYDLTPENIKNFRAVYGKKGVHMLSFIGKHTHPFYTVIKTEIGQQLLKEVMNNLQLYSNKILNDKANDKDRALFDAYRDIFESWCSKIDKHLKMINQIKGASK
jgi:hypothetical protein